MKTKNLEKYHNLRYFIKDRFNEDLKWNVEPWVQEHMTLHFTFSVDYLLSKMYISTSSKNALEQFLAHTWSDDWLNEELHLICRKFYPADKISWFYNQVIKNISAKCKNNEVSPLYEGFNTVLSSEMDMPVDLIESDFIKSSFPEIGPYLTVTAPANELIDILKKISNEADSKIEQRTKVPILEHSV